MISRAQYPNIALDSRFFVFEGIDGSGKTTQIKKCQIALRAQGYDPIITREPYDFGSGGLIRKILDGREKPLCDARAFQALYVVARREHLHNLIIPALKKERTIILCDRYIPSTFVYGAVGELTHETVMDLHMSILGSDFLLPDATFLIDINPDIAMSRMKERSGDNTPLEYFEKKKGFMHKAAPLYLEIAEFFSGTHVIPGDDTEDIIAEQIMSLIKKHRLLPS